MLRLIVRQAPLAVFLWLILAAGCTPPTEGFETELLFTTPVNQDPMASIDSLEFVFQYLGNQPRSFVIDAPFPKEQILDELPRAEAGEVRVEVSGLVHNASSPGGYDLAASGFAEDFAMPPDEPIQVFFALKGQMGLLAGGLANGRSDGRAMLLEDGRVVVVGGIDAEGTVAPIEVLFEGGMDLNQPVVSSVYGDLPRTCHNAFVVEDSGTDMDGKVVVVGGDSAGTDHICLPAEEAAMEVVAFDADSGDIETLSTLESPILSAQGAPTGDGTYTMFGGFSMEGTPPFEDYFALTQPWQFDAESGSVDEISDWMAARTNHTVTLFDENAGEVLVGGGLWNDIPADDAERWSDANGDSAGGEITDSRMFHTATALADRTVLFTGGCISDHHTTAGTAISSAELWTPGDSFTLLADGLANARQRHAAAAVGDSAVLLCGGVVVPGATSLNNCEFFDLTGNSFSTLSTVPLDPGGEGMMAVPLGDGRVLLMGGMSSGAALSNVYIYVP